MPRVTLATAFALSLPLATLPASHTLHAQTLPTFNVSSYGATGSANTGVCSGQAGSQTLTNCSTSTYDFAQGQRIRIVGGGPSPASGKHPIAAFTAAPKITEHDVNTSGTKHVFCYIVSIADPLQGITAPSQQTCSNPEPSLSLVTSYNEVNIQYSGNPFSPSFLWYVSEDGGPFQLLQSVGGITGAYVRDDGQAFITPSPALSGAASSLPSRGGWPTNVQASAIAKNEDLFTTITGGSGNQITISDPVGSTFTNSKVYHDDTIAIQSAISAAAANGGTVQLGNGTYNVFEPLFVQASSLSGTWSFSRDYSTDPANGQYFYLSVPNGSKGSVHLEGSGSGTILAMPPDQGLLARLIAVGATGRPAYLPYTTLGIYNVDKGSTQMILSGNSGSNALAAGDDIYLFSGSFGAPTSCDSKSNYAGGCHFSELNSIVSVASDGNTTTLKYAASKRYYPDQYGSTWGVVKVPGLLHDIALEHMTINTYDPITGGGQVIGLLFNDLHINGYVNGGPFGNDFKRGVTIENSIWGLGAGDDTYADVDEYDQYTDVSFAGNTVYGDCATQASGRSAQCRIYGTEGSSNFTFTNNNFYNVSVFFDQTTNNVLTGNTFVDGDLNLGLAYGQKPYYYGPNQDSTYLSFGSATNADVEKNSFQIDSTYAAPFIPRVGNFTSSSIIATNTVTYNGTNFTPAIWTYSGAVTGNTVTIPSSPSSDAIVIVPDEVPGGQPSKLSVQNNIIKAPSLNAGIFVPDVGFNDTLPTCIQGNTYTNSSGSTTVFSNPSGQAFYASVPSELNLSCQ